jgi:hypothetical protein
VETKTEKLRNTLHQIAAHTLYCKMHHHVAAVKGIKMSQVEMHANIIEDSSSIGSNSHRAIHLTNV